MTAARPLPDALFIRFPVPGDSDRPVLAGFLHVLQPPLDDEDLVAIASTLADQLIDDHVRDLPEATTLPLWLDPSREWSCGEPELREVKRLLARSAIVQIVLTECGEHCLATYRIVDDVDTRADINRALANGLIALHRRLH